MTAGTAGLVDDFHPSVIRTQDYAAADFSIVGDHADHTTTAQLAQAASAAYSTPHAFVGYIDYNTSTRPANVSTSDLAAKQATFYLYDTYDSQLPCYTTALRAQNQSECDATRPGWLASTGPDRAGAGRTVPGPRSLDGSTLFGGEPPSTDDAQAQIRAQGCSLGAITYAYDHRFPRPVRPLPDARAQPHVSPAGHQGVHHCEQGAEAGDPDGHRAGRRRRVTGRRVPAYLLRGAQATGSAPVKGKIRTVTAQTPKAGAEVAKGSTIRLTSKVV